MKTPAAGVTLAGKYAVGRRLGAGGYGAVYEGENLALGKKVAIKLIDKRHDRSEEAIGRFRREARAGAMIESPNIVQVFDVGEDAERGLYMVMELLRGDDLRHKLDRHPKLEVDFAVVVAHQVAQGLAKAHAAGVVHRDLKPANVFLHEPSAEAGDDQDRVVVKIVDFGVAKLLDDAAPGAEADRKPLTSAGRTVGTPQYMSPEQVQGLPYDHRADLWSLGAVLYEMLAGRPAFLLKDTFQETALAIVLEEPPPLRTLSPDTPPEVAQVVERALAKEPSARYADAAAFADALMNARPRAFRDQTPAAPPPRTVREPRARPSAPSDPPAARAAEPPESRRRIGAVVAIAVLAAAAAVLVLAALRASKPPPVAESTPPAVRPLASLTSPSPAASPAGSGSGSSPAGQAPSVAASVASSAPSTVASAGRPAPGAPKPPASAKPSAKPDGDPFGSVGVSNSY